MFENYQRNELPGYSRLHFIGRGNELGKIQIILDKLAANEKTGDRVVTFVGEVGTGKSWLINRIRDQVKDFGATSIFLDLLLYKDKDDPFESILEILREVQYQVTGTKILSSENPADASRQVMEMVHNYAKKNIIVLLVDHVYETEWGLLTYIDQYLLSSFAANSRTVIVLAGRGRPYPWNTPEIPFRNLSHLEPFGELETKLQIEKQVPDSNLPSYEIHKYGGGIPMQNYLLALYGFPKGLKVSLELIFQPLDIEDRPRVLEYLKALCVLKSFDDEKISWMWEHFSGEQISHFQARNIRELLVRYGFAQWSESEGGYVLDQSVHTTVSNLLYHDNQTDFRKLNSIGAAYMEDLKNKYENFPIKPIKDATESHIHDSYFSILATPELIGRKEIINQINTVTQDRSQSYIAYIYGPGGVGKTRLLQELQKQLTKTKEKNEKWDDVLIASELVDLFHTKFRTDLGMAKRISEVLSDERFTNFKVAHDLYLKNLANGRQADRGEVFEAFMNDLREISNRRRIVLFFDTAEQLLHKDPAAVKLGLKDQYLAGQGRIFKDLLPNLFNSVIVIAGRTNKEDAKSSFNRALTKKEFVPVPLIGLSQEESVQYFDKIITAAEENNLIALADRLRKISSEERDNIYQILRKNDPYNLEDGISDSTGVRPLWLSLVVDYLITEGNLPLLDKLNIPDDLIRSVLGADRPGRELLPIIGLTAKGATVDLLYKIIEEVYGESRNQDFLRVILNAESFVKLSFVKARREGKSIYITFHDEVSKWVRNNFNILIGDLNKKTLSNVINLIQEYYKEKISLLEDDLRQYDPKSLGDDYLERENKSSELREYRVDQFYYHLLNTSSATEAFDTYFIAAEDALAAADRPLENMLTSEMQSYINDMPNKFNSKINNKVFTDVNAADAAVRWVKRWAQDYSKFPSNDLEKIEKLVTTDGDALATWDFNIWMGLYKTYEGQNTEEIFLKAIKELSADAPSKREKAILARAFNNYGYYVRRDGNYKLAISNYEKAVALFRETKIKFQDAYARNNLAFAYAEIGHLATALHMARDAYEIRRAGQPKPIGLSLNTMAHILIRDDRAEEAVTYGKQALDIFNFTYFERGQGLSHTVLAEAERRTTESPVGEINTEKVLRSAIFHGKEGIKIFSKIEEPVGLIEAYIETGCAYRDLAKFQRTYHNKETTLESAAYSSEMFIQAEKLSAQRGGLLYRRIDSMVNRAWLKYYIMVFLDNKEEPIEILDEVENIIEPKYILSETGQLKLSEEEKRYSPFLSLLGKSELLRGHICLLFFEKLSEQKKIEALRRATRHYVRSLCYNNNFSEQIFRSLRRTKSRIYEQYRGLNISELKIVIEVANEHSCGKNQENLMLQLLKEYALVVE